MLSENHLNVLTQIGLSVECFLPSPPSPQNSPSLLAPDLNKYLQPPKHYEGII